LFVLLSLLYFRNIFPTPASQEGVRVFCCNILPYILHYKNRVFAPKLEICLKFWAKNNWNATRHRMLRKS
jgi:hypothetical protein